MSNIWEIYRETATQLSRFGEGDAEAQVILAHVYDCAFSALILRAQEPCEKAEQIAACTARRLTGMPLAYVLGEKFFYGRRFVVDEHVLIPRFDTEYVVAEALKRKRAGRVLDLCCGSGCIGVTLAAEGCFTQVTFADISQAALDVARRNAAALVPMQQAEFVCGDLFEQVTGTFDLIVCNPPYISAQDYAALEPQVRDYEPKLALTCAHNGLEHYVRIAQEAGAYLNECGALILEIGDEQAKAVTQMLAQAGFQGICCGEDATQRPRFISCIKSRAPIK